MLGVLRRGQAGVPAQSKPRLPRDGERNRTFVSFPNRRAGCAVACDNAHLRSGLGSGRGAAAARGKRSFCRHAPNCLQAIEMFGLGNWSDISTHVGTKSKQDCEQHYFEIYLSSATAPLPVRQSASFRVHCSHCVQDINQPLPSAAGSSSSSSAAAAAAAAAKKGKAQPIGGAKPPAPAPPKPKPKTGLGSLVTTHNCARAHASN